MQCFTYKNLPRDTGIMWSRNKTAFLGILGWCRRKLLYIKDMIIQIRLDYVFLQKIYSRSTTVGMAIEHLHHFL